MKITTLQFLLFISAFQVAAGTTSFDLAKLNPSPDTYSHGAKFATEGQILLICDGNPRRITIMSRHKPNLMTLWDLSKDPPHYRSGDVVSTIFTVSNSPPAVRRERPNLTNAYFLTKLTVTAPNQPPPTSTPTTVRELHATGWNGHFASVSGIVSAVQYDPANQGWIWITLRAAGGIVRVATTEHDYSFPKLNSLINTEVRLSGIPLSFSAWRRTFGAYLILFGSGGIDILRPSKKPFEAPQFSSTLCLERQQTSGTVIGTSRNRIFITDKYGQFLIALTQENDQQPKPGEKISIAGFAEVTPLGIQFSNAILRRDTPSTQASLPSALNIDPERMFTAEPNRKLPDATLYGKVICVRGLVTDKSDNIHATGRFALQCGLRKISVDVSTLEESLPDSIDAGSIVDVSGVCLADFNTHFDALLFPTFKGFELVPRTPADIVVIQRPPFWTAKRLTIVVVLLVFVLLAILVWNMLLRTLSERRGRELMQEQLLRVSADLRTSERTRLAVELHDALSQSLTGVALQLDAVQRFEETDPSRMRSHLSMAIRTLKSCRDELRNCLWDLRNRTLEEKDMNEAVRRTVSPFIGETRLLIRFNIARETLSDETAHALLRIIRELSSNAVRHGGATTVRIAGALENGQLLFSVSDDGCGFDPNRHPTVSGGHFGLEGIRERISRLNGDMKIKSDTGCGTTVTIALPA